MVELCVVCAVCLQVDAVVTQTNRTFHSHLGTDVRWIDNVWKHKADATVQQISKDNVTWIRISRVFC
ncbi:hypothetical protein T4E_6845 [Trichinella pseudospiralis]|uniref:Secreted protein n=1 Tax=Trichinella pseudospiralis TaxID=6337 RepID=A0A0V0YCB4_TRIPS|nr:hypothetical protein T4E_6845 [Trichinella pseudospiralis]